MEEEVRSAFGCGMARSAMAYSQSSRQMTCFASVLSPSYTKPDSLTIQQGKQAFIKEHAIFLSGPDKFFSHVHGNDKVEALVVNERDAPESAHTNPSSLPDSLLLSVRPIFQIRDPILMFPSMVRAEQKAFGLGAIRPRDPILAVMLTLRYSRALYDWYRSQDGDVHPEVIDADDVINDKAAVRHICNATGLSPDAVQYEWEAREEADPKRAVFLSTINSSKGIIPGLAARGLDFDSEKTKWKAEFGEEDGEDLAKFVLDALPDYNYLLAQRTYIGRGVDQ